MSTDEPQPPGRPSGAYDDDTMASRRSQQASMMQTGLNEVTNRGRRGSARWSASTRTTTRTGLSSSTWRPCCDPRRRRCDGCRLPGREPPGAPRPAGPRPPGPGGDHVRLRSGSRRDGSVRRDGRHPPRDRHARPRRARRPDRMLPCHRTYGPPRAAPSPSGPRWWTPARTSGSSSSTARSPGPPPTATSPTPAPASSPPRSERRPDRSVSAIWARTVPSRHLGAQRDNCCHAAHPDRARTTSSGRSSERTAGRNA